MAKNNIKITEPILYSFIKNEIIGTQNFNEIKRIFEENEDIENKVKELFTSKKLIKYIDAVFLYQNELNINFRYYQFLAILFTEIFLDNFFKTKKKIVNKINSFIKGKYTNTISNFNKLEKKAQEIILEKLVFTEKDL